MDFLFVGDPQTGQLGGKNGQTNRLASFVTVFCAIAVNVVFSQN